MPVHFVHHPLVEEVLARMRYRLFFFFQAEDGIRDKLVTGVQTCALPILENSSGNSSYQLNSASVEELVMSTSGISADTNADGLVVNVIPKEGSNTFRTELSGLFSNHSLESNNLDDNLRRRGLTSANRTIKLFDESASVGGPIKRDTLWFFVAPRSWGLARGQAGVYWNKTQNVFLTPSTADREGVLW